MAQPQFSLRTLLTAVAFVGIGTALWVAEPSWKVGAVEALLLAWVPTSAAILSVHSRDKVRSFWMGVTAQFAFALVFVNSNVANFWIREDLNSSRIDSLRIFAEELSSDFHKVLAFWAFAPVVGFLCVLTHWLLVRPASAEPKD